jgi:fatty-acyl-CoA synthase
MNRNLTTIPERLRDAARENAGELIFHLQSGPRRISAQELWSLACARAEVLRERGVGRGDRVGVVGPNVGDWAAWAFGVWVAGGTVVPLQFPLGVRDRDAVSEQLNRLARRASCRVIACERRFEGSFAPEMVVPWDEPLPTEVADFDISKVRPDDVAVIQFTSGSTGDQKGVVLEHDRILYSVEMVSRGLGVTRADRFMGWAPLYHDLGLFGYLIRPLAEGCEGHILPTERFARDPAEWFRVMTHVEATLTTAPSSGYAIALKGVDRDPSGYDLSALRAAIYGAEVIMPEVVDRTRDVGRRIGMDPAAVAGSYGMAEATLTIAVQQGGMRMETLEVDRMAGGTTARPGLTRRVCSCGSPLPGMDVRITGGGDVLSDRWVGEIEIRSYGLMRGYLDTERAAFDADGWFATGDLGYMSSGEVFVTGRLKDVIIVMGANYAPEDLEWASSRVQGVRAGRCVAFGRPGGREGEVVIALEARDEADGASLPAQVKRSVSTTVGVTPNEVLVLPKGTIPKTTSGKLRRGAVREAYARGELTTA